MTLVKKKITWNIEAINIYSFLFTHSKFSEEKKTIYHISIEPEFFACLKNSCPNFVESSSLKKTELYFFLVFFSWFLGLNKKPYLGSEDFKRYPISFIMSLFPMMKNDKDNCSQN